MPENTSEPNQGHTGQIPVCHKCSIPMQLKMTAPHKPRRPLVLPADILEYLQVPHMRALGDLDFRDVIGRKRNDLLRTAHGCRRFHYALRQVLRDYGFEASNADSEWYRRALVSLQAMQTFATNRCVLGRLSWRPRPVPSSYADIQPAWAL
jgi:hypothetical protein